MKPQEGLCSLAIWQTLSVPQPSAVQVSRELFAMLRAGALPWPEGGACSEELRSALMKQFGLQHTTEKHAAARAPPRREPPRNHSPSRGGYRRATSDPGPRVDYPPARSPPAASPEPEAPTAAAATSGD